jgi:hypothetical protein
LWLISASAGAVSAETETAAESPPSPCELPEARQLDFWVGEWDLTWGDEGRGTNVITVDYDGCVIIEHFDGNPTMALRGLSTSVYNVRRGRWQQTWVDNQGGYLDFVGGLEGDRMILSRKAEQDGQAFLQRMVWYNISESELDWNWERSLDDGATWETLWQIHYVRR